MLDKYRNMSMDVAYANLAGIGYKGYSTSSPKYDKKKKRLYEYIVSIEPVLHKAPFFNYIHADEVCSIEHVSGLTPVTALRYNSKVGTLDINNLVSWGTKESELIHGLNRQSYDMDGFLQAFVEEMYGTDRVTGLYGRMCAHERITQKSTQNIMNVSIPYVDPDIVAGLPALVYDTCKDILYYGLIGVVDMFVNTGDGYAQTNITLKYPQNVDRMDESDRAMKGIPMRYRGVFTKGLDTRKEGESVYTIADNGYYMEQERIYKEIFYNEGYSGEVTSTGQRYAPGAVPGGLKHRNICSLRQYLEMYGTDVGDNTKNIQSVS
ncbi:MAG: hypothetical protein Q8M92_06345, partial [Candidatus Subteraquimicrobiales bacterium]|nr:hypothetical protein [Candidatus Subteraquimicrobiales bacterium]